jgi:hypothetical protein
MKCPHCSISFHPKWAFQSLQISDENRWYLRATPCPECKEDTVDLAVGPVVSASVVPIAKFTWVTVHPRNGSRGPIPAEVPTHIAEDYREASEILLISPKASAALARRCLQTVLRENGYSRKDLYQEIDALLKETDASKAIPESLRMTVDGIRHFGNFSAHPITDLTSLQIIPVEPHEAEWCLDILDEVFEHFYVRPAKAKERKALLDAKLLAAGKNPSK